MEYVGREVKKITENNGTFIGKVNSYDAVSGSFQIVYQNDVLSEEMDLSQITNLIARNSENCNNGGDVIAQLDQLPDQSGGTDITRKVGRPRKKRRVNVGKKLSNSGLGKMGLDLNEEAPVISENGELILDLNKNDEGVVGLNLDLNRNDYDVKGQENCLDSVKGLEMEGCKERDGIIDLNVDVNEAGGMEEDEVSKLDDHFEGLKRKDRDFDLNLGFEDEMKTLDGDSHVLVICTQGNVGVEVNCENQALCSGVCSGNVEEQTPVKKSGSESINEKLRDPSADSTVGGENMGSQSKGKRGRKRKKISADTPSNTETVLRRSSRRTTVVPLLEQVPVLSSLDVGDDSSAISGVSEEKVLVPSPEEPVEHLDLTRKVELPPSSAVLNLEGMAALDVFSVYSFLRSFSMVLFLSPFELEDFVAALRCNVPSLLFDSIHVSLLHTLRKQMVSLGDDNLPSPCDCLRFLNWDLLDLVTWPVFLVEYLIMHSHSVPVGFDLHHLKLSGTDYYSQPVHIKIEVLQCLCDEVTAMEAIWSELNIRTQGTELGPDSDRKTRLNHSKRRTAVDGSGIPRLAKEAADERADWNGDECCLCKMDGSLICCDGCPAAFHARCVGIRSNLLPEGDWHCPECRVDKKSPWLKVGKSIRGAELLGTDPFGRLFYSSCGYLLVSEFSDGSSSLKYYHRNDLVSIIEALKLSTVPYRHILNKIHKNWHLSSLVGGLKEVVKPVDIEIDTVTNCISMETQIESSAYIDCTNRLSEIHQDPETPKRSLDIGEFPLASASLESEQGKNENSPPHGHSSPIINEYVNHYSFSLTSSSLVEHLGQKESDNKPINATRTAEDIISGQLRAISSTFIEFFWPNIYNQYVESRKEKCGWCYYCQFPEYEKGCIFINKDKHFSLEKFSSKSLGVQPSKNRKGHLVDVMCYMLYMEDRLRGLLLGPWLNPVFSKMWRQSVLEACEVDSLKKLLLMLESNIHHLAVSADWLKPVDSALSVGSAQFVTIGSQRMPTKQGNGKKKARYMDSEVKSSSKSGLCLFWWRGGNISRELFNHKALPHSLARKAARQAGCKKIPDVLYPENSEVARRNRSIAWHAALEASFSVQKLALQVRELDSNIKWDEIENTTIFSLTEIETKKPNRSFKKVIIRRKCSKGIISKYLLDFGKRRFIPDVVLQHGTLFEDSSSERKRYWLEETYLPLHLLKRFEEKRIARRPAKVFSGEVQNSLTLKKPFQRKGFSYIFSKAERLEDYQCGHCKKDVLIRDAVSCQYCKGIFHKRHVKSSGGAISNRCTYTCHKCREGPRRKVNTGKGKTVSQKSTRAVKINRMPVKIRTKTGRGKQSSNLQVRRKNQVVVPLRRSPRKAKSILPKKPKSKVKRKGKQNSSSKGSAEKAVDVTLSKGTGRKRGRPRKYNKDGVPLAVKETSQRKRTDTYRCYWLNGLRLSSKPNDERVMDFRTNNFMSITEELSSSVDQPKCGLCGEVAITPLLNYIACQSCGDWFHGDAFDLTAERISIVIGFKCHKCRSIDSPGCPHLHDKVTCGEPFTPQEKEGTERILRSQVLPKEGSQEQDCSIKERVYSRRSSR